MYEVEVLSLAMCALMVIQHPCKQECSAPWVVGRGAQPHKKAAQGTAQRLTKKTLEFFSCSQWFREQIPGL